MSTGKRALGMIGLVVVGVGAVVILNWDAVSNSLGEALDGQSERTRATLFRLGELMSMSAELKTEYGVEPDMAYDTASGARILSIAFSDYRLPDEVTAEAHAREIAAFAVGKTTKVEDIDAVTVLFQTSDKGVIETTSGAYSFTLDELMSPRPPVEPVAPDDPARGQAEP